MSLSKFLEELASSGKSLKHTDLTRLSNLSKEEMLLVRTAWLSYSVELKNDILTKMLDMAEDNVELDFSSIFRFCLKDANWKVREKAIHGLWECEDRSLIGNFTTMLKEDPSENVRAASAEALGKYALLAEERKLLSKDGERILQALLDVIDRKDEVAEVQRRAIESVAPFNNPRTQKIIQDAYASSDVRMRYSAVYAMGKSYNRQWLSTVIKELGSKDSSMRYEAANACGHLGEAEAVPHLIGLIQEKDPQIQLAAVSAIGAIGGPLARRALQRCTKLDDDAIKEAAEEALANVDIEDDPLSFR